MQKYVENCTLYSGMLVKNDHRWWYVGKRRVLLFIQCFCIVLANEWLRMSFCGFLKNVFPQASSPEVGDFWNAAHFTVSWPPALGLGGQATLRCRELPCLSVVVPVHLDFGG